MDVNEVMETGDVILAEEKARASCQVVRVHSQHLKENDWTCFTAILEYNI